MAKPHRIIPPLTPQNKKHFWSKVDARGPDECWPWVGNKWPEGYGVVHLGSRTDGSRGLFRASRVAWALAFGPIPLGLCVLHHCDNPSCCNPVHLFLGTLGDNNRDAAQKGRIAHGEMHHNAKVTECAVRKIRQDAANGVILRILSREYGLCLAQISRIVRREQWAHVL